ncbi:MAG: histidinol-phosphate transaminase [Dysgonamonadaceae bacterium]|jgi:histidinol-phosphate aminotransferase|nr:histidinol-phosphate transaminase [Dysgonamonadaceae bacterium]
MNLQKLIRNNILSLKPYSSARDEFRGEASVYLDAIENPYNAPYNRYPDPLQRVLKEKIARLKNVRPAQIMLGNGSDEPIDLVVRIFCEPAVDNITAIEPTYGMYRVAADINNVDYRTVLLDENFDFKADDLLKATDEHTKVIFLCSPNNPTGNSLNRDEIVRTVERFPGIVVLDEAYIDFSIEPSFLKELDNYPNLMIFQTFSKAWGSASIRLGMAFASEDIIACFNKVKYPYNINRLTQEYTLNLLDKHAQIKDWIKVLLEERNYLAQELSKLPLVEKIYPSDANFILVKVPDAKASYQYLVDRGIIVRNRSSVTLCLNCLRITVGTREENLELIQSLKQLK